MKKLNVNWKYWLLAALVICAIASLMGYPIIPAEAIAGAGMLPMMAGEVSMGEVRALLEKQGDTFEVFKKSYDRRMEVMEDALKKSARPGACGLSTESQEDGEYKDAVMSYMRTGREIATLEKKSMVSGSDPDGGFLIAAEWDREITKNLRELTPMRKLATVRQVGSSSYKQIHSRGGTTYGWVGETASRPETSPPKFKELEIPTKEIYAMPGVTQGLLDDNAFGLEPWLIDELTEAFGDGEGDAFINGDGVNKPRGLFTFTPVTTSDATRDHDKFQYVPTGASGAFAATQVDALLTLIYAVKPRYRANASWLVGPDFIEAVRKLKNPTTSEYIWRPGSEAGQPDLLLGYPVYEDANVPTIAANSLSAAFGDFKRAYTITDRSTSLLRDPFTSKPYVLFYSTKRVGGGAGRDTRAVKFLKFSAS